MNQNEEKLNTIGKAIAIIEIIHRSNRSMSIKDIAAELGYNKSSLHHHMKTLTQFGYLQQDQETRNYDIGLDLVRVGQSFLQRLDIRERGHHALEKLSRELNETVHLLILDKDAVVYIDKVDVNHQPGALKCSSYIGLRTDIYSTAAGKVLLSHLERGALENILQNLTLEAKTEYTISDKDSFKKELQKVKQQGYSLDLQEHIMGLQCIAMPILNQHSQCIAAVSVSSPSSLISKDLLETEILDHLKETSREISISMGYIPKY